MGDVSDTPPLPLGGLGDRVRAARRRRGYSREELAYRAGLSWAAISQVESGRRANLRPSTLSALARALGVTIDYLVASVHASPPMLDHRALLYEKRGEFVEVAAPFLAAARENSEAALAVTSRDNLRALRRALGDEAKHVRLCDNDPWYRTPLTALKKYRSFLDHSMQSGATWVRVVGEPVWTGRSTQQRRQWAEYESLLNELFRTSPITLICPYDLRLAKPAIAKLARATHPRTQRGEVISDSTAYLESLEFVIS
jgi:transcriptional regulator with XRE-family HTH domain